MVQVFKGLATMLETQVQLSSVLWTNSTRLAWEREGRKDREGREEWSHRHSSLAWEREGREEWSHRHGRAIEYNDQVQPTRVTVLLKLLSLLCTYSKIVLSSFSLVAKR